MGAPLLTSPRHMACDPVLGLDDSPVAALVVLTGHTPMCCAARPSSSVVSPCHGVGSSVVCLPSGGRLASRSGCDPSYPLSFS
uniref:Uncharacterized protein n=1 Tax=Zea mays TaxID=4577 RepID=C4IZB8_MAIZE|nr:unknown [Zea mays]